MEMWNVAAALHPQRFQLWLRSRHSRCRCRCSCCFCFWLLQNVDMTIGLYSRQGNASWIDEAAADRQTVRHITYTCLQCAQAGQEAQQWSMSSSSSSISSTSASFQHCLPSQMGFWTWVCALFVYNVLLDLCLPNALYKYVCRQLEWPSQR